MACFTVLYCILYGFDFLKRSAHDFDDGYCMPVSKLFLKIDACIDFNKGAWGR